MVTHCKQKGSDKSLPNILIVPEAAGEGARVSVDTQSVPDTLSVPGHLAMNRITHL